MAQAINFAFLHGGGQAGWIWRETLEALDRQMAGTAHRALAFDLPGCGAKRGLDVEALTVQQVAEHFAADLSASGLQDVVLVGHSNAGTLMPRVAALLPEQVGRLVYVSCVAPAPGQTIEEALERPHASSAPAAAAERWRAMFCNDMDEAQATGFLTHLGQDRWPTRQALKTREWLYDHLEGVASTYVLCLRDQALSPERQEVFAERLRVGRRVRIDAGHQVMNTRPHALAEVLRHEARG